MTSLFETRRYLSDFDAARTGHVLTDVLVVGSGVGGARAALAAARHADVVLVSKSGLLESATRYAQGGIACVTASDDSTERHCDDTLTVGCGLNHTRVVDRVVRDGPAEIRQLIEWGCRFDLEAGVTSLALEGGHSRPRVLHAQGDATGRELAETLVRRVRGEPRVRLFEHCFVIDLLTLDGVCVGAVTFHEKYGHQLVWAKTTVLAGGGCGRLFRETTNPENATGDAVAMAYRAGAGLRDLEMVQFHPTTLYVAGASRALISEAVRGEGAQLVDRAGRRFMPDFHADAELAPRDVVSRAIASHIRATRTPCVYLDIRPIGVDRFRERFPGIARLCVDFGIDPAEGRIPVRPAAHYLVGGILADAEARSTLPGLYVCGESASSGLHGANRLASNSLLEGLVLGRVAGERAGVEAASVARPAGPAGLRHGVAASPRTQLDLADIRNSLVSLMWRNVGIERHGDRLRETVEIIEFWGRFVLDKLFDAPAGWEAQNMLTVGRLIALSAEARKESRGVHYRSDYPEPRAPRGEHLVILRAGDTLQLRPAACPG